MHTTNRFRSRLLLGATALLVLGASLVGCGSPSHDGPRVVVLGFDGMDPVLTQQLIDDGRMPNLAKLVEQGTFQNLETSIPPQSPVAWSSFMTGMDPGGHGIFDFIHRDPETMFPEKSEMKVNDEEVTSFCVAGANLSLPAGDPYISLRTGAPFWEALEEAGVPAHILRMPANFPPSGSATVEVTGMGTPDLNGSDGTFSYYTSELFAFAGQDITGGEIHELDIYDNVVEAKLYGPPNPFECVEEGEDPERLSQDFKVYLDPDKSAVKIELGDQEAVLSVGEWTPWMDVEFEMLPGMNLGGIARMYLRSLDPEFELYVSPIDIDPRNQAFPVTTPASFGEKLAENAGLYYTEGMPEDTKSITDGVFGVEEFLSQAQQAGKDVWEQFPWVLDNFLEENAGFLFYYVGNVDLTGHIMWRSRDPDHPYYQPEEDAPHEDLIPSLYEKLDELVGHAMETVPDDTLLVVMSDHGFASQRWEFNLNVWLRDNGYLTDRGMGENDPGYFSNIDWSQTKAYGVGFSGLYINEKGRERDGIVPFAQKDALLDELTEKLLAVDHPETGERLITQVFRSTDYEYQGAMDKAPDLLIGYAKGVGASSTGTLGGMADELIVQPNESRWTGNHIMDHTTVPGVLITSRPLEQPADKLRTLAGALLAEFGVTGFPDASESATATAER